MCNADDRRSKKLIFLSIRNRNRLVSEWSWIGMFFLVLFVLVPSSVHAALLGRELDCDPCIDRQQVRIRAILPAPGIVSEEDPVWNHQRIEASMRQASVDMHIDDSFQIDFLPTEEMATAIRESTLSFDTLIVSLPDDDENIKDAIKTVVTQGMPVFGVNGGYEFAQELGVLGYCAQDEYGSGETAALELYKETLDRNDGRALFVQTRHAESSPSREQLSRKDGFSETFLSLTNGNATVDTLQVNPHNLFEHVTLINDAFQGCDYDVIMLGSADGLPVALAALQEEGCTATIMGTFDATPVVMEALVNNEQLVFGISSQPHLQAALPVYLAALYATTHKALALPLEEQVYWSGPTIVRREDVPSDTAQLCEADAFPVCGPLTTSAGEVVEGSPGAGGCPCTDRSKIRLGGVLHGVKGDNFWNPIFASAQQAARDMGVELDLIRFDDSSESPQQLHEKMAARIRLLCESGVDGMVVTIPSEEVLVPAIQRCLELNIPVMSVNAGIDTSRELGLMHHIGMLEYNAGYGAGERLMAAGMTKGFCLNHEPGNIVTQQRCDGMRDAIFNYQAEQATTTDQNRGVDVTYGGTIETPLDSRSQFNLVVEDAVKELGDWEGIGLVVLGQDALRDLLSTVAINHPKALLGSFDLSNDLYDALDDGTVLFGIDQQPFLQGVMPIYLLALNAYTNQFLKNHVIESGPSFVIDSPSKEAAVCEANFFQSCPDRPPEEMNFISPGLEITGYVLFGVLLVLIMASFGWVIVFRHQWIVKISQPTFMLWMLVGVLLTSLAIPFIGIETTYRNLQDDATGSLLLDQPNPDVARVDVACMAVPWLYGMGFVITFVALFTKIQRVQLIYQAGLSLQRRSVQMRDVLHILILLPVVEIIILLTWQLVSPRRWVREVLNASEEDVYVLESYGHCSSHGGDAFFILMVVFHAICLVYALVLSYQTRSINHEFAESGPLFLTVMFLFQVQVLAVPLVNLVQDDPDGLYFVLVVAIFLQSFTVLCTLFVPKLFKTAMGQGDLVTTNMPVLSQMTSTSSAHNRRSARAVGMPRTPTRKQEAEEDSDDESKDDPRSSSGRTGGRSYDSNRQEQAGPMVLRNNIYPPTPPSTKKNTCQVPSNLFSTSSTIDELPLSAKSPPRKGPGATTYLCSPVSSKKPE